jgi:hypothetical protein
MPLRSMAGADLESPEKRIRLGLGQTGFKSLTSKRI